MVNPLLILINSGEFISVDHCINYIIANNLQIDINDLIKYIHINFFDFIDITSIYDLLIFNHQESRKFIISDDMVKLFKLKHIKKYIKKCKLVENVDFIIIPTHTSWVHYMTHFGHSKKEYRLTPFAFKYILIYDNPTYIRYILLLDLCINHYITINNI